MTVRHQKETICLVAILKNEEKFLDEWLIYHKMIGIDYFLLYDDDPASHLKEFLRPHFAYVEVIEWAKNNHAFKKIGNQLAAYKHAVENHVMNFDWVIFLDADEFVVLKKHKSIQAFLLGFKNVAAISLHWCLYGHNGFITDPPGLITSHLNKRMRVLSAEIKSITRTNAIAGLKSPHYCDLKYGHSKDDNNNVFSEKNYPKKSSIARINHYKCRSFNNWMSRVKRGDVNFNEFNNPPEHLWRLDSNLCFNEFVNNIAPNYNEITDNFMLKYKFKIYENVLKVKHERRNSLYIPFPDKVLQLINQQLDKLAHSLMLKKNTGETACLNSETLNICLFYFAYSKHRGDMLYRDLADTLLTELIENSNEISTEENYQDLIKLGCSIEYLVQNRFLDINTFNFLEDIDFILGCYFESNSITNLDDLIQTMRYYILRVTNVLNASSSVPSQEYFSKINKHVAIIKQIFDQFLRCFTNYTIEKKIDILLLLCDAFDYYDDKQIQGLSEILKIVEFEINTNPGVIDDGLLQKIALAYLKISQLFNALSYQIKAVQYSKQAHAKNQVSIIHYSEGCNTAIVGAAVGSDISKGLDLLKLLGTIEPGTYFSTAS